jgi:hypothetical protein
MMNHVFSRWYIYYSDDKKKRILSLMPVNLTTQEAEIRRFLA